MADGLADAGFKVEHAPNGKAAEAALASVDGHAVLIADRAVDAGGPNGFQLAASALERFASLRVVYVSGTHIAVRRRPLGERERGLLKPFSITQLVSAVKDLS